MGIFCPGFPHHVIPRCLDATSLAAVALAAALLVPARAAADEGPCTALRKSFKDDPIPVTLFQVAECEEKAGRLATAAVTYDDYLKLLDSLSAAEQREEREREHLASARQEALKRDLPRITLTLPASAPAGTRVTRIPQGGGDPFQVALNVPLPIDPGEHFVTVEAPGRPRWDRRFFIHKGEAKTLELEVPPPSKETMTPSRLGAPVEPVPAYLPPLNPGISGRRVAAYVAGGIGVAGVVVGAVTGVIVWADKGIIEDNCENRKCNRAGEDATDQARTLGGVSTVTFIVGLAGLATGAVLYLTEPTPAKLGFVPKRVTVGSAGLRGAAVEVTWNL